MKNIYILTDEVRTGKTTRLIEWSAGKENIFGILQPAVDEGRFIINLRTNKARMLSATESIPDDQKITVGKFSFDKKVFEWAQKKLLESLDLNPEWLIVDEVGILELDGSGLEPAIGQLIQKAKDGVDTKILFVVRKNLYEKFIQHFNLCENEINLFDFCHDTKRI